MRFRKHSAREKSGRLPLFQAPIQSAFLLILNLRGTVNLFHLDYPLSGFALITLSRQAFITFHSLHLFEPLSIDSLEAGKLLLSCEKKRPS